MERISERMRAVMGMFGLQTTKHEEAKPTKLHEEIKEKLELGEVMPGEVVLICGASGSGKSTLLRAIEAALRATKKPGQLLRLTDIPLSPDHAVVDCFSQPLAETLALLSRAGLSEARVWLRKPAELSEGEQFRYRLARWMASSAQVLLADEFCAPLDRITARVVAWQLGKFVRASRRCAIVATSHEDLLADLQPTRVIRKTPGFQHQDTETPRTPRRG